MPSSKKKRPYSERSDIEKIQSNWKKIAGLLSREEWSGSIIRATTATEIAANLVIREELINCRQLEPSLVDHFLYWANGIQGKFDKLILPTLKGKDHENEFKKLKKCIEDINKERNAIVHTGKFSKQSTAERVVAEARKIILSLVKPYYDDFELQELP